jgi:hypothetical protein
MIDSDSAVSLLERLGISDNSGAASRIGTQWDRKLPEHSGDPHAGLIVKSRQDRTQYGFIPGGDDFPECFKDKLLKESLDYENQSILRIWYREADPEYPGCGTRRFHLLPDILKKNREFLRTVLARTGDSTVITRWAHDDLKKDPVFMASVVRINIDVLEGLSVHGPMDVLKNDEFMMKAVQRNGNVLHHGIEAPNVYRDDREYMYKMIVERNKLSNSPRAVDIIQYCWKKRGYEGLLGNKEFMLDVLQWESSNHNGSMSAMQYCAPSLKAYPTKDHPNPLGTEFVYACMTMNWKAFEYLPKEWKTNKDFVKGQVQSGNANLIKFGIKQWDDVNDLAAMANPLLLKYIMHVDPHYDLRWNKSAKGSLREEYDPLLWNALCKRAIAVNPRALRHAGELKKKFDVIMFAVKKFPEALRYADRKMRANFQIVMAALAAGNESGTNCPFRFASRKLRDTREVCWAALKKDGYSLAHASRELQDEFFTVCFAISRTPDAIKYASDRVKRLIQSRTERITLPTGYPSGPITVSQCDFVWVQNPPNIPTGSIFIIEFQGNTEGQGNRLRYLVPNQGFREHYPVELDMLPQNDTPSEDGTDVLALGDRDTDSRGLDEASAGGFDDGLDEASAGGLDAGLDEASAGGAAASATGMHLDIPLDIVAPTLALAVEDADATGKPASGGLDAGFGAGPDGEFNGGFDHFQQDLQQDLQQDFLRPDYREVMSIINEAPRVFDSMGGMVEFTEPQLQDFLSSFAADPGPPPARLYDQLDSQDSTIPSAGYDRDVEVDPVGSGTDTPTVTAMLAVGFRPPRFSAPRGALASQNDPSSAAGILSAEDARAHATGVTEGIVIGSDSTIHFDPPARNTRFQLRASNYYGALLPVASDGVQGVLDAFVDVGRRANSGSAVTLQGRTNAATVLLDDARDERDRRLENRRRLDNARRLYESNYRLLRARSSEAAGAAASAAASIHTVSEPADGQSIEINIFNFHSMRYDIAATIKSWPDKAKRDRMKAHGGLVWKVTYSVTKQVLGLTLDEFDFAETLHCCPWRGNCFSNRPPDGI